MIEKAKNKVELSIFFSFIFAFYLFMHFILFLSFVCVCVFFCFVFFLFGHFIALRIAIHYSTLTSPLQIYKHEYIQAQERHMFHLEIVSSECNRSFTVCD